jgi:hypothetical protein
MVNPESKIRWMPRKLVPSDCGMTQSSLSYRPLKYRSSNGPGGTVQRAGDSLCPTRQFCGVAAESPLIGSHQYAAGTSRASRRSRFRLLTVCWGRLRRILAGVVERWSWVGEGQGSGAEWTVQPSFRVFTRI